MPTFTGYRSERAASQKPPSHKTRSEQRLRPQVEEGDGARAVMIIMQRGFESCGTRGQQEAVLTSLQRDGGLGSM